MILITVVFQIHRKDSHDDLAYALALAVYAAFQRGGTPDAFIFKWDIFRIKGDLEKTIYEGYELVESVQGFLEAKHK